MSAHAKLDTADRSTALVARAMQHCAVGCQHPATSLNCRLTHSTDGAAATG